MRIGRKRIESRFQEVSEIVREIKAIAKELNLNVIALSQLSRDVEKRGVDALPKLSDLRESGRLNKQPTWYYLFTGKTIMIHQTQKQVWPI